MKKIYLSYSNRSIPEDYLKIKEILEKDFEILEWSKMDNTKSTQEKFDSSKALVIVPGNKDELFNQYSKIIEKGKLFVSKGQYIQLLNFQSNQRINDCKIVVPFEKDFKVFVAKNIRKNSEEDWVKTAIIEVEFLSQYNNTPDVLYRKKNNDNEYDPSKEDLNDSDII